MTVKPGWARKHPAPEEPPPTAREPAPSAATERRLWDLTRDEQRLLWITVAGTFVGGLASIIGGACVIAGAIAIARNARHHPERGLEPTGLILLLGALLLLALRRKRWSDTPVLNRVMRYAAVALWSILAAIVLLVWIGTAAGLK
jgi:hypothetical protein